MDRLKGKVCVITGAAFGIGRATAIRFAQEGARLVLTDIQEEPLLALASDPLNGGAEVATVDRTQPTAKGGSGKTTSESERSKCKVRI